MAGRRYSRTYEFEALKDLPKSEELDYPALRPAQEDWCDNISHDPRANNTRIGSKVIFAHRTANFPNAVTVFVSPESEVLENKLVYPDFALEGTKDKVEVVYVNTPDNKSSDDTTNEPSIRTVHLPEPDED